MFTSVAAETESRRRTTPLEQVMGIPRVGISSGEHRDVFNDMWFGPAVPVKSQSTP
jgi:hypothetical protein